MDPAANFVNNNVEFVIPIRNKSKIAQPYPPIYINLTDSFDRILVRCIVFAPAYLLKSPSTEALPKEMAPLSEVKAVVRILNKENVAGFGVGFFSNDD